MNATHIFRETLVRESESSLHQGHNGVGEVDLSLLGRVDDVRRLESSRHQV